LATNSRSNASPLSTRKLLTIFKFQKSKIQTRTDEDVALPVGQAAVARAAVGGKLPLERLPGFRPEARPVAVALAVVELALVVGTRGPVTLALRSSSSSSSSSLSSSSSSKPAAAAAAASQSSSSFFYTIPTPLSATPSPSKPRCNGPSALTWPCISPFTNVPR
jgi:hypothetical protein